MFLNRETVVKSFSLLNIFKIFFELNRKPKYYLSLIHNYDPLFLYSKLNVDKIQHLIIL